MGTKSDPPCGRASGSEGRGGVGEPTYHADDADLTCQDDEVDDPEEELDPALALEPEPEPDPEAADFDDPPPDESLLDVAAGDADLLSPAARLSVR